MNKVFIGLGTNLGNRSANLNRAYTLIEKRVGEITLKSHFYQTPPWGFDSTEDFLNSVILVETNLSILALFNELKKIETEMGRQAKIAGQGYQDRVIDLDILDFNNAIYESSDLTVPHQKMHLRAFVLYPFAEIAPKWLHPILKVRSEELLDRLENTSEISKLEEL